MPTHFNILLSLLRIKKILFSFLREKELPWCYRSWDWRLEYVDEETLVHEHPNSLVWRSPLQHSLSLYIQHCNETLSPPARQLDRYRRAVTTQLKLRKATPILVQTFMGVVAAICGSSLVVVMMLRWKANLKCGTRQIYLPLLNTDRRSTIIWLSNSSLHRWFHE